jgi:hypothetical protein
MDTRTGARPRLARKLSWLVVASLTGAALLAPAASVQAASVAPVFPGGTLGANPTCADLAAAYGNGQTWLEIEKINGMPANGTYGEITISGVSGQTFSWTSTVGIDAVLVKAGSDNHAVYVYAPTAASAESFGDTDLTHGQSQQATSHVSFCADTTNPPPPTDAPPTDTPPTDAPPTDTPPTDTPPTDAPPTDTPPTDAPPTDTPPTDAPPTDTPPTEPPDGGVLPTATPAGGVAGSTGTPNVTLPPTDTLGSATSAPAGDGWRVILLAMAGLLAGALLLTPASAVVRRKDDRQP